MQDDMCNVQDKNWRISESDTILKTTCSVKTKWEIRKNNYMLRIIENKKEIFNELFVFCKF